MAEEIRTITVEVVVNTNKDTYRIYRELESLSELDDLHQEMSERLG